jgi:predicted heme/steroid binding protein/uncharacterized membrane protein
MAGITPKEFEKHDGTNGNPSYVAIDGNVYDVSTSPMWKNGKHMATHSAGSDLTDAISSAPHGKEVLKKFTMVGILDQEPPKESNEAETTGMKIPPVWAEKMIALHSHPISSHFPQAFFVFAPLFLALFYLTGRESLERTAYHLLFAGFITAFPAIITGFIHWWYKFAGRPRPVFRLKIYLSLVLLALGGFVLGSHTFLGVLENEPVNWIILFLYFAMLPIVVFLGRAGGLIVFEGKGR